jgi:hypothetical protein
MLTVTVAGTGKEQMMVENLPSAGITATREGCTEKQLIRLTKLFKFYDLKVLHHGDCRGGDEQTHAIAVKLKMGIVIHPPTDDKLRAHCRTGKFRILKAKPYLVRNKDIVNDCTIMFACPKTKEEEKRSGTWSTIRYTKLMKHPLIVIYPDGTGKKFNMRDFD